MERLKPRLAIAKQAHATLTEALRTENPTALERDGAIQRFEYTFEVCWKLCQLYLRIVEGIDCASPKGCLRSMGEVGLLTPEETKKVLIMADDRNRTVHIYQERIAKEIYDRLTDYSRIMRKILDRIEERTSMA